MKEENTINIAIVSRQRLFRQGMTVMLQDISTPAQTILSYNTTAELEDKLLPGIVLLHISNEETETIFETISSFKKQHAGLPLLLILSSFNEKLLTQLRQTDASGYLFIYSEPADFKAALSQVMKGRKYYQRPQFLPGDFDNLSNLIRSYFE